MTIFALREKMTEPFESIRVTFRIMGDNFSPEEVTKTLGIEPKKQYNKSDLRFGNPRYMPYQQNGWHLDSPITDDENLEMHILAILDQLSAHGDYLKAISENNLVEFYCSVFSYKYQKAIYTSSSTVQKMASIGAGLMVITYLDVDDL